MVQQIPFTLDISKAGSQRTITGLQQGENNTNKFVITLVNGSEPFVVDSTVTAILFGVKPDGKLIVNYMSVERGKLTYTLGTQDTAVEGITKWQIKLAEYNGTQVSVLASAIFASVVGGSLVNGDDITSLDEVGIFLDAVVRIAAIESVVPYIFKYKNVVGSINTVFNTNTELGILYHYDYPTAAYDFINLDSSTQIRYSNTDGLEVRTKSEDSWTAQDEWVTLALAETYASLVSFLAIWNNTDYVNVVNLGTVSNTTAFNEAKYCAEMVKFNFTPSGQFAAALGTSSPCTLIYNSEYQIIEPIKRAVKIVRKVNSVAPTFSAGEWGVVQKDLSDEEVTAEKLNPALASRIFLKQDSNINISEATTVGSYRVNLDSLSSLNLDLPYGATINNYYWSCYVFKPSTLNNSDVTQVLIGHHQATNETVIFTRTSINKVFRSFIKIHPVYTANASEPIAINEALNTGTYPVINATLSSFNTALRLKWGTTYENYDWYVKVDKIDDTITQQILYGYSTNDTTYAVCYYRRKSGNSFSTFRKLSSEFKNQFNATNIEDARDTGFYRINYNSLTELTLDLPSGRTINEYYWTCIVLRPSTLAGSDCMQRLMGHSQSGNEYVEFIRTSINGTFRTFTRIYPLETNAAGSVTNICFIGDSFTANRSDGTSFVNYLSNINKVYTNLGVSGTTPYSWYNKHENDITNDYDVFFVALGLNNDPNGNGTIDSTDPQTFVGGMRQIIEKIIATAPKARIIIWCMDSWYTESKSELCKQLAEIYGCEYYSMKASKEIPLRIGGKFANVAPNLSTDVISAKNNVYRVSSTDGHPNSVAQKMLATYLETVL